MAEIEFVGFDDADSDRPGMVVANSGMPPSIDDWWTLIIRQAWDDDWWYGDPNDPIPDGARYADVTEQFTAWCKAAVTAPQWRWWATVHEPDCDRSECGEQCGVLGKADPGDEGAFLAALVTFVGSAATAGGDGQDQHEEGGTT